jgi:hypothetical protein
VVHQARVPARGHRPDAGDDRPQYRQSGGSEDGADRAPARSAIAKLLSSAGSAIVGFLQSGTGAVQRLVQDKLRDIVHSKDFGLVGDGSDETTKLTAFLNSAIARPGVQHLIEAKTYGVSATLPDINISNVWIEGAGAEIHDVGTVMTGTVIKWVGGTSTGPPCSRSTRFRMPAGNGSRACSSAISGSTAQSGAIGTALSIKSLQESDIDVATANAFSVAVAVDVVAALGEARDVQRNRIRINGRQVEAPNGYTLTLNGDSGANASMNEIDIEAQCKNVRQSAASIRITITGASSGWPWRVAEPRPTAWNCSVRQLPEPPRAPRTSSSIRARFHSRRSARKPIPRPPRATSSSASTWTTEPRPGRWEPAPPSPCITNGRASPRPSLLERARSPRSPGASGSYLLNDGGFINFAISFTLTTNGTGATQLRATLPFAAHAAALARSMSGAELSGTGKSLTCTIAPSGTYVAMTFYDGTYPGADGRIFTVSGTYRSVF